MGGIMKTFNQEAFINLLNKFRGIEKIATMYSTDFPLWTSIIFDAEDNCVRYIGGKFRVKTDFDVRSISETSFVVNYQRLRNVVASFPKEDINIKIGDKYVVIKWATSVHKLLKLNIDFREYLQDFPETTTEVGTELTEAIKFCTIASSVNKMDATRNGVTITNQAFAYATDGVSGIASRSLDKTVTDTSFLIKLPWCEVLPALGVIRSLHLGNKEQPHMFLSVVVEGEGQVYEITLPVLKVDVNPTVHSYLSSFESAFTIGGISKNLIKKMEITTDNAYSFVTVSSGDGTGIMESKSKTKGETVQLWVAKDMPKDVAITISTEYLKKAAGLSDKIDIDLENLVAFVRDDKGVYAFRIE
jgi:hypothetical protein